MAGPIKPTSIGIHAVAVPRAAREPSAEVLDPPRTVVKPSLPRLVSLAAELSRQGPPIDYAKIAQIRQAIALGRYEIDLKATLVAIFGFYRNERDGS
jgi:negative regulator of flagellin synthesis FlgM